jgi:methionine-rich copper-binding protein CopC
MANSQSFTRTRQLALALTMAAAAVYGAPAQAHARLAASTPAAGAVLASAPASLRLQFSEVLEAAFSTLSLRDGRGAELAIGKPALDPHDQKVLTASLPRLASGSYQVRWSAASHDGHRTRGTFSFDVK